MILFDEVEKLMCAVDKEIGEFTTFEDLMSRVKDQLLEPLDGSDFSLVKLEHGLTDNHYYPHCKRHGAMNKVSKDGLWRCVSHVTVGCDRTKKDGSNLCRAGCKEKS